MISIEKIPNKMSALSIRGNWRLKIRRSRYSKIRKRYGLIEN